MGSAVSHSALSDAEDSQNESVCLTPSKRLLYVDPRSPSAGITRTPILVEKTPPADMAWDPRSPTPGIVRTPISNANNPSKLVPSAEPVSTELFKEMSGGSGEADMFDNHALDLEDAEAVLSSDSLDPLGLHRLSLDQDEDDSCHLIAASHTTGVTVGSRNRPGFGRQAQLPVNRPLSKQLFSKREKRPGAKLNSSDNRSPLRSRNQDTDSPRNIIQRKQISTLDNKISYRTAHSQEKTPPSRDKENLTNMSM